MSTAVVSQIPLFSSLPESEVNSLVKTLAEIRCHPGEIFIWEGSLTEYLYILVDGEVEIVKSLGTPDERVLARSNPGALLGEMCMFSPDGAHTASARARTPVRLLAISFGQFDALLQCHPELAYSLLRLYSSRLQDSENLTVADLREKNRELTLAYLDLQAAQAAMIEKEKLEHEVKIAADIQRGILPEKLPVYPGWDFGAVMFPARVVGGDFYDFIPLDHRHMGIVIGDVCDKGMPASLFMALSYSSIRAEAFRSDSPGKTLRAVNRHLMQMNRSGMFVTLLYGVLDLETGQFRYARAGHLAPLLLDGNARSRKLPFGFGQPIGMFKVCALDEQTITVPPGATLLLYSDGLSETVDSLEHAPGLPEFCSSLLNEKTPGAQALCDCLWRAVGEPAGMSLIHDDFTVVAVKNLSV